MARKTLHDFVMREAAVCGRMKPRPMPTSYHIRFPYTGSLIGNSCNSGPLQHAVDNKTLITLCGRRAGDWGKIDASEKAPVTCERCKKKLGETQ